MRSSDNIVAVLATAMFASVFAQTTPPAQEQPAPTVTLIGCVERVEPPASPAGKTAPPAYKLIDVQPGTGQKMTMTRDTQFLLQPPANMNMKLSDFQNQWVEVTGTLASTPMPPASAGKGEARGPVTPLSTINLKNVKVVSTECKAPGR